MSDAMKILFVSSEMSPRAKSGGLADVVSALPQALRSLGHDARVIMPLYKQIKDRYHDQLNFMSWSMTKLGWRSMYNGLFQMEVNGVPCYFIDNEYYFGHDGIYLDYAFDIERFAFFQRAVLDTLGERLDFHPQFLHLNDWQAGAIPLLLEAHYQSKGYFLDLKTVFTIHNLKYQGIQGREKIQDLLDLPDAYMREDNFLKDGAPNFMKAGIVYSNRVTTVSPSYAEEILLDYYGEGLNHVLQAQAWKVRGILNALDVEEYNPKIDPHIAMHYDQRNWRKGKAANKQALQERLGLPQRPEVPVFSMVTRLVSQKGVDLLLYIADELLEQDMQLVVMGTGDYPYEDGLRALQERHPDRMRAMIEFDEPGSRLLYAGADVFLMPSLFEPCGLSQMMAMRYGTLPLVRETGGLRDTVQPYNRYDGSGTGFSFSNINAHELLFTAKEALNLYYNDQPAWGRMVRRGLTADFSWEKSAKEYLEVYQSIIDQG